MRNFGIQIRIRPQDLKTNAILQIFVFGYNNVEILAQIFPKVQPESVRCHVLHYNCMREGATAIEKEQDEHPMLRNQRDYESRDIYVSS